ncbi:MAG TPA: dTMP kinase [Acidobacteriota bacterium]
MSPFEAQKQSRPSAEPKFRYQRKARTIPDRGLLITFEGIDGSGKSTQALLLAEHLESCGLPVRLLREPTQGVFGRKIRALASAGREQLNPEQELRLFVNDRLQDVLRNIRPALRQRRVVVLDRYYLSTVCYQGELGLDAERIRRANESFAPRPDLILMLDLPVPEALRRIVELRQDRLNLFEHAEYLERVRARFLALPDPNIAVLDASRPAAQLAAAVRERVGPLIDAHMVC